LICTNNFTDRIIADINHTIPFTSIFIYCYPVYQPS
jgi:hypothetical protein